MVECLQLHNRWGVERWQAVGVPSDFDSAGDAAPRRAYADFAAYILRSHRENLTLESRHV